MYFLYLKPVNKYFNSKCKKENISIHISSNLDMCFIKVILEK